MNPILTGRQLDAKHLADYERRMVNALEEFSTKWLGRGNRFIVGDTVTVADLQAACEIEQPSEFIRYFMYRYVISDILKLSELYPVHIQQNKQKL